MINVALCNGTSGAGATSVLCRLAWSLAHVGARVLAVDLDARATLSASLLDPTALARCWPDDAWHPTILGVIEELLDGGAGCPDVLRSFDQDDKLRLLAGDPGMADLTTRLSLEWGEPGRDPSMLAVQSALYRSIIDAAVRMRADVCLLDVAPGHGALTRAGLLCAEHVVLVLSPTVPALEGMRRMATAIRGWRTAWTARLHDVANAGVALPAAAMRPTGYVWRDRQVPPRVADDEGAEVETTKEEDVVAGFRDVMAAAGMVEIARLANTFLADERCLGIVEDCVPFDAVAATVEPSPDYVSLAERLLQAIEPERP